MSRYLAIARVSKRRDLEEINSNDELVKIKEKKRGRRRDIQVRV